MTDDAKPTTPVDPPGRPHVPRARWSRIVLVYAVIAGLITIAYVWEGLHGRDLISARGDAEVLPPSVRASPGGYRSFAFWHSGYEGGK